MPSRLPSLAVVLAAATLSGCGVFFHDAGPQEWTYGEPPPPEPRTAYSMQGMVTDRLYRPVEGAELELRTSRPDYSVRAISGPGGRFELAFSALASSGSSVMGLFIPGAQHDSVVRWVELRARAGDRCSFPIRRAVRELADDEHLVVALGPCPAPATAE
jgi:hypothetical protein